MLRIFLFVLPALLVGACGASTSPISATPLATASVAKDAASPPVSDKTTPARIFVTMTQATPTAISLQWTGSDRVVDYEIARNGEQVMLAEETQRRFRDMDLSPDTTYSYTIKALDADGRVLQSDTIPVRTARGAADFTDADVPPPDVVRARSLTTFGWTPNPLYDTCSKALHDSFWTFGPDNKAYPTWHPPVYEFANGTTCRFGHEHGQDPRPSNLYHTVGPIPFGYVNEQLSPNDPAFQRNEDHVGHKIAMFNGLESVDVNGDQSLVFTCDVLFKLHQGTHSPDALRNNSHERFLNYKCQNGAEARWKGLQPFGSSNTFHETVANVFQNFPVTAGAVPGQPYGNDRRIIPTNNTIGIDPNIGTFEYTAVDQVQPDGSRSCDTCRSTDGVPAYVPAWSIEVWQGGPGMGLRDANGNLRYGFGGGPYWHVNNPARYYDPNGDPDPTHNATYRIARQIDQCYNTGAPGYPSFDCRVARARNGGQRIPFDSPLSPFKGTIRFNEVNFIGMFNPDRANERIYLDPYGRPQPSGSTQAGVSSSIADVSRVRTAALPIRLYVRVTPSGKNYNIMTANFAGSQQVGGPFGHGRNYTDFGYYRLRNGQTVDAGIHVPN